MNFTEIESDNVWYQPDELELLLGNLELSPKKVSAFSVATDFYRHFSLQ